MSAEKSMPLAVMGNFQDPDKLIHAAEAVRDAGYEKFDIYTPYPVHGLDQAMGVKRTPLTKFSLTGGLVGLASAVGLMYWTGAVDYKLVIGGKPLFAVQFGIPVMFELTVLLTGLTTFTMLWVLCGLPSWFSKYQHDAGFRAAVDDTFVVSIHSDDAKFSADTAKALLQKVGADDVRLVEA